MKKFSSFVKEKSIDEGILGAIKRGIFGTDHHNKIIDTQQIKSVVSPEQHKADLVSTAKNLLNKAFNPTEIAFIIHLPDTSKSAFYDNIINTKIKIYSDISIRDLARKKKEFLDKWDLTKIGQNNLHQFEKEADLLFAYNEFFTEIRPGFKKFSIDLLSQEDDTGNVIASGHIFDYNDPTEVRNIISKMHDIGVYDSKNNFQYITYTGHKITMQDNKNRRDNRKQFKSKLEIQRKENKFSNRDFMRTVKANREAERKAQKQIDREARRVEKQVIKPSTTKKSSFFSLFSRNYDKKAIRRDKREKEWNKDNWDIKGYENYD